jgi:phosphoribosyl-ATP pyrophosphohydrolase
MTQSAILETIWETINDRVENPRDDSYTCHILTHRKGIDKALEKVGEESAEFIIAVKNKESESIIGEASDLIFHLMLAVKAAGLEMEDVYAELAKRHMPTQE